MMDRAKAELCKNGDGRKEYRNSGLCQRCYYARPRQLAAPGEGGQLGPVRVPAVLIEAMEKAAEAEGVTLATWRRRAYEDRFRTQTREATLHFMPKARALAAKDWASFTPAEATFRPGAKPSAAVEFIPARRGRR